MNRVARALSIVALAGVPLSCASAATPSPHASGRVRVEASFYPLQYVVERVGGDRVTVSNLTPIGAEPHDIELTASDTAALEDSDLVVYLSEFSPAVDDGIASVASGHALDVAPAARLDLTYTPIENSGEASSVTRDPHFWLDPTRLAAVTTAVVERLGKVDPAGTAEFESNGNALIADLDQLDGEFRSGLASCASTVLVTSHNAFGYLAARYGLTQIGITGLTPEDEPSPRDLAAVSDYVEKHHVSTIYYETLVSPSIAETVATETGARVAVLDPIEGLTDTSAGGDYLAIMRADLATLRAGQVCS